MSEFNNVNVPKAANQYFDGKVTSRTLKFENGDTKTLGIMMPGEYTFGTQEKELMEITSGELEYKLDGSDTWNSITGPDQFYVDANSSFDVKSTTIIDYCCSYIKE
jgi:uncharacterized protein YaiE (UPF0345 family)